jgi:hypothetical protein
MYFYVMRNPQKIKNELHSLIDNISNNDLLEMVYQLLESKGSNNDGELLNKLTLKEKEELYKANDESLEDNNLVDLDQIKKDHSKWQED